MHFRSHSFTLVLQSGPHADPKLTNQKSRYCQKSEKLFLVIQSLVSLYIIAVTTQVFTPIPKINLFSVNVKATHNKKHILSVAWSLFLLCYAHTEMSLV